MCTERVSVSRFFFFSIDTVLRLSLARLLRLFLLCLPADARFRGALLWSPSLPCPKSSPDVPFTTLTCAPPFVFLLMSCRGGNLLCHHVSIPNLSCGVRCRRPRCHYRSSFPPDLRCRMRSASATSIFSPSGSARPRPPLVPTFASWFGDLLSGFRFFNNSALFFF